MKLAMFAAVLVVVTTPGVAQINPLPDVTLASALEKVCALRVNVGTTFNSDGRIRADNMVYCAPKDSSQVPFLVVRTSAMNNAQYRGRNSAPWLNLQVVDRAGNVVASRSSDYLAEVANCGGYMMHIVRLPGNYDRMQVADVRVSMGGASYRTCSPSGLDKEVKNLQTRLRRWSQGEFSDEERRKIEFLGPLLAGS